MRTVTFSDAAVVKEVNEKFVPVWLNRGEGFHNCETQTEQHIFQSSHEAYSTRNICTFFMTADRKVIHYVAGYYAPDLFREVLKFAGDLKSDVTCMERFQAKHARFAQVCGDESRRIDEAAKKKGWKKLLEKYGRYKYTAKHTHSADCLHGLGEAMSYWVRLHTTFASYRELPDFEKVRKNYLYGNSFSEEKRTDRTPVPTK